MLARRAKGSSSQVELLFVEPRDLQLWLIKTRTADTSSKKPAFGKFMVFFGNTGEFRFLRGRRSAMIAGCAHMPPAW